MRQIMTVAEKALTPIFIKEKEETQTKPPLFKE